MKIKSSTLLLAPLLAISAAAQTAPHFDGQTWWNHIKVLADDKLEGRDTGSRGERAAQAYAIEQLKSAGAEPAGVNGFYQPVKFVSREIVEKDCSLSLIRDGKREPLILVKMPSLAHASCLRRGRSAAGLRRLWPQSPGEELRRFRRRRHPGKIIVIFSGSPSEIPGALASHYQTAAERWKVLRAAGAIGIVSLMNPPPWTSHGPASRSTVPIPAWISTTPSSTKPKARRSRYRESRECREILCRLGSHF